MLSQASFPLAQLYNIYFLPQTSNAPEYPAVPGTAPLDLQVMTPRFLVLRLIFSGLLSLELELPPCRTFLLAFSPSLVRSRSVAAWFSLPPLFLTGRAMFALLSPSFSRVPLPKVASLFDSPRSEGLLFSSVLRSFFLSEKSTRG